MTTYEEISTDSQANFDYWTAQAKYYLSLYKERQGQNVHENYVRCAKLSFRSCIKARKEKEFLN
jgi:hypothetical protein